MKNKRIRKRDDLALSFVFAALLLGMFSYFAFLMETQQIVLFSPSTSVERTYVINDSDTNASYVVLEVNTDQNVISIQEDFSSECSVLDYMLSQDYGSTRIETDSYNYNGGEWVLANITGMSVQLIYSLPLGCSPISGRYFVLDGNNQPVSSVIGGSACVGCECDNSCTVPATNPEANGNSGSSGGGSSGGSSTSISANNSSNTVNERISNWDGVSNRIVNDEEIPAEKESPGSKFVVSNSMVVVCVLIILVVLGILVFHFVKKHESFSPASIRK